MQNVSVPKPHIMDRVELNLHTFFTSVLGSELILAALPPRIEPPVYIGYEARCAPKPVWM
jgi:hypothetical protein